MRTGRGKAVQYTDDIRPAVTTLPGGPSPSPWLRSPVWDGFWMLSALWLVPVALWLSRGAGDPQLGPLDSLYFGLTALFWIGHRLEQHLSRLLHRGLSAAAAHPAGAVRRAAAAGDRRLLRGPPAAGQRDALEPRGASGGSRHHRLRVRDLSLRGPALRRAFALPLAHRTERRCADAKDRSDVRPGGRWRAGVPRRPACGIGRLSGPLGRSLRTSRLAGRGAGRDPHRRHGGAARRDRSHDLDGGRARRDGHCHACSTCSGSLRWWSWRSAREARFSSSSSGPRSTGSSRPVSPRGPRSRSRRRTRGGCDARCTGSTRDPGPSCSCWSRSRSCWCRSSRWRRFAVRGEAHYGDRMFGAIATGLRASTPGSRVARSRLRHRVRPLPARPQRLPAVGPAGPRRGTRLVGADAAPAPDPHGPASRFGRALDCAPIAAACSEEHDDGRT